MINKNGIKSQALKSFKYISNHSVA